MEMIYLGAVLVTFLAAEPVTAIQCYNCMGLPTAPQEAPSNCLDPFNAEGIQTTECDGKCFANSTTFGPSTVVQRGCWPDPTGCPTGCSSPGMPPGEMMGTMPPDAAMPTLCSYCCDGDHCNSDNVQETATAGAGEPINCWQCQMAVTDDLPAGSCASDDFKGKDATSIPCQSSCVTLKTPDAQGNIESVMRGCDPFMGANCGEPGVSCCMENECNVGEKADGDGDGDGNGDVKAIQCWKCNATATNKTSEQSACEKGNTDTSTKVDCPTGKCISFIQTGENGETFFRDCVPPILNKVCDAEKGSDNKNMMMMKEVECCTGNLCNKGATVVTSAIALLGAFLVSWCLAFV
ncbi:uncharacterized protein [Amphiura filiformis]|uniref:uncharacterized protein isoform X1 n=1 Tax=Amphiura filiformis TaxID=82378 RepID=UPI003B21EC79